MMPYLPKDGFTLIELMVVIAIMSIIAALAVASYKAYVIIARNASALAQLNIVKNAQAVLVEEIQCYGVSAFGATLSNPPGGSGIGTILGGPLISATAKTSGAMITGQNSQNIISAVPITVGSGIILRADTDGGNNSSCLIVVKHLNGDTVYGNDSDTVGVNYWVRNPAWVGQGVAAVVPGAFPAGLQIPSCTNKNDFQNAPGGGIPTANWTYKQ